MPFTIIFFYISCPYLQEYEGVYILIVTVRVKTSKSSKWS
jgi:hypothetical protein